MVDTSNNFKASASFNLRPARSQVVLVGLTVAAIFALLLSGTLFALDKPSGWIFTLISISLFSSVVWCWRQSHRDTDLAQSHPTQLELSDGTNLSTDSRLLSSPEGVRNLAQILETLALRHPLPEPTGMVRSDATLIPNSKQEAVDTVKRINAETQTTHNQTISSLQTHLSANAVTQTPADALTPPIGATRDLSAINALIKDTADTDPPS